MNYFDAHCHLQDSRYTRHQDEIFQVCQQHGVRRFAVCGTNEGDWPAVSSLSHDHPHSITPNFGLHPWFVGRQSDSWRQRLHSTLYKNAQAGLGECGLDKGSRYADMETQEAAFLAQLCLGKHLNRPISVHCVRAFGRLAEIVRQEAPFPAGLILHSWAGSADITAGLAKLGGIYFSISGHLTRIATSKASAMLAQVPLDRLLLETDCPDGLPQIGDGELADRIERAAGSQLQVMLLKKFGGSSTSQQEASQPEKAVHRESSAGRQHSTENTCDSTSVNGDKAEFFSLPLCWHCPLRLQSLGGQEVTVQSPGSLLNLPVNLRVIAGMVAVFREDLGQKAIKVVTTAAFENAERLFNANGDSE